MTTSAVAGACFQLVYETVVDVMTQQVQLSASVLAVKLALLAKLQRLSVVHGLVASNVPQVEGHVLTAQGDLCANVHVESLVLHAR